MKILKYLGGYTGSNCQVASACANSQCLNGGSCQTTSNGGYVCLCSPQYTGYNCQTCKAKLLLSNT